MRMLLNESCVSHWNVYNDISSSIPQNLVSENRRLPCVLAKNYQDLVDHLLAGSDAPSGSCASLLTIQTYALDAQPDKPATLSSKTHASYPTTPTAAPWPSALHQSAAAAAAQLLDHFNNGLTVGAFFGEAGWHGEAIQFLRAALRLIQQVLGTDAHASTHLDAAVHHHHHHHLHLAHLQCLTRLLHAEARYYDFPASYATHDAGAALFRRLGAERVPRTLRTMWFAAVSVQYFARSDYENSNRWGVSALKELCSSTPDKLVVDVLRQTAKACVLKRQFERARMLLGQALLIAKQVFGVRHYKYADVMMDFAFYLLNVDLIANSVKIYQEALKIRVALLGARSLHVAIAEEDLAYALYVHNYSSGNFHGALDHVNRSISVMKSLVPATHLFLASAKRVKALILEEIALEHVNDYQEGTADGRTENERLLLESEQLHQSALRLSLAAFGEVNVQTAKHYGNLGRLYQSMTKYEDAERMHNLAIKIKTDILGPCDFEVGLSIGHLASLYNYHMYRYRDAEVLYLRSIDISNWYNGV